MKINITPDMTPAIAIAAIEGAVSGDVVSFSSGTYKFCVYLTNPGVVIESTDPLQPAVFDYSGANASSFPASGRAKWLWLGPWQIDGSADDVTINNITIQNASNTNTAQQPNGIFLGPGMVVSEPAPAGSMPANIVLNNVTIQDCGQGLGGGATPVTLNNCLFQRNGVKGVSPAMHNIYMQGGVIVDNNSRFLDCLCDDSLALRTSSATFNGSFIDGSFGAAAVEMMTPKADMIKGVPFNQIITFNNCEITGKRNDPTKTGLGSFIIAMNSNDWVGLSQNVVVKDTKFTGASIAPIVQLAKTSGTSGMGLSLLGNTTKVSTGKWLYLAAGEVPTSSYYTIVVDPTIVKDSSLPANATPPVEQIKFAMSWAQETITAGFSGWNIYASTDPNNWGTPVKVNYVAGMAYTHEMSMAVGASSYYFKISPVNVVGVEGQGASASVMVPVPVDYPVPGATTNFVVQIVL